MARNKESLRYSYAGKDAAEAKFFNKNFNKTESYRTNFSRVIFRNTSLVGAKFKFCNLNLAKFENCLIQGALFRKCKFEQVVFENCILMANHFDRTSLLNTEVSSCYMLGNDFNTCMNIKSSNVYSCYPDKSEYSEAIIAIVSKLKSNEFIRKSSVLHRKRDKINTIALDRLINEFGEDFLVEHLDNLQTVDRNFHTISYLTSMLRKINQVDSLHIPGPQQHRKYLLKQTETSLRTDAG